MDLPYYLNLGIEKELENIKLGKLSRTRSQLTDKYRSPREKDIEFMSTPEDRIAYICSRLPSIFSVIKEIIFNLQKIALDIKLETLLDLGSGPGTVMYAVTDILNLENITLVEKDRYLIEIGKRLAANADIDSVKKAEWINCDINKMHNIPSYDLVTSSYVLNEMREKDINNLIEHLWAKTNQFIIFAEPGTPDGFKRIKMVRSHLISMGANIIAPCPHQNVCPITEGDWCHFSKRVERTKSQRILKKGELSYEDEKYSYIVASKNLVNVSDSRVIRHPQINKGHVGLKICTKNGLKETTISRKDNEIYKKAQKIKWGDEWLF